MNYKGFYIHEQDNEFHIYLCQRHFTEGKKPFVSYQSECDAKYAVDDIMQSYPIVQIKYPATGEWSDFVSIKDETDLYYGILMCDGIHHEFRGEYRILARVPGKVTGRVVIYPDELRDYLYLAMTRVISDVKRQLILVGMVRIIVCLAAIIHYYSVSQF